MAAPTSYVSIQEMAAAGSLAPTDLLEIAKDVGGGAYSTRSITAQNVIDAVAAEGYVTSPGGTTEIGGLVVWDNETGSAIAQKDLALNSFLMGQGGGFPPNDVTFVEGSGVAIAIDEFTVTFSADLTDLTGEVPVANGGTGANTAADARANLSAAKSGANTDITSLVNATLGLADSTQADARYTIPQIEVTSDLTIDATHFGKMVIFNSATVMSIELPSPLTNNAHFYYENRGAGSVIFSAAPPGSLSTGSPSVAAQGAKGHVIRYDQGGVDVWSIQNSLTSFPLTNVAYINTANIYTAAQTAAFVTLTDAATVAINSALGNNFNLTLGGNRTLGVPTNMVAGRSGLISVRQDITGTRTLAYAWPYVSTVGSMPILSTAALSLDQLSYMINSYATSTVTITIATPGVVTWTSHGLISGQRIQLTTTGALPTGLTASTTYWVTVVNANTFQLSTSLANAQAATFIATSGTQSGVHTATHASITLTINPGIA